MEPKLTSFFERHRLSKKAKAELEALFASYDNAMLLEPTVYSREVSVVEETHSVPEYPTTAPRSSGTPASVLRVDSAPEHRYETIEQLGAGGMGRVMRVRDHHLQRVVAMKLLKHTLLQEPEMVHRFLEEAKATAQLQHPGIVPVYDLGQYTDGQHFFTMKEVKGRTLSKVIQLYHVAQQKQENPKEEAHHLSLRGLIDTFRRVCETVSYAHSRGVCHRDLKPDNIMLGEHGEVLVLDWGLVKITNLAETIGKTNEQEDRFATQAGVIQGTPAYMSPEQARGEHEKVGFTSDVYALGAILYQILSGRPPVDGKTVARVLSQVIAGEILPPGRIEDTLSSGLAFLGPSGVSSSSVSGVLSDVSRESSMAPGTRWLRQMHDVEQSNTQPLPAVLVQICDKAMSLRPEDRYAHAGELSREIANWLEGAKQRERGLAVVASARALFPKIQKLREHATISQYEAEHLLNRVEEWESEEKKLPGWEKQEKASQLLRDAQLRELEAEQLLQGALTHAPDLVEAHLALSDMYRQIHLRAERAGDEELTIRTERRLRSHLEFLPPSHETRQFHLAYLKGDGALSLHTSPPGVEVRLFRYVRKHRRVVPVFEQNLGSTPLIQISVARGSYLLELHKEGHETVYYPVWISRLEHWDGIRPKEQVAMPILMPKIGALSGDVCYVPGGWYAAGGDNKARGSFAKQQIWVDAFGIQKFPVTNQSYLLYLNDLVQQGREEEALRVAPQWRTGDPTSIVYHRNDQGFFVLPTESTYPILPNHPVVSISWFDANAYAHWWSVYTGETWRLASEIEWEKAARGVDGRLHPWGEGLDPSYCCMSQSHRGEKRLQPVESFPIDESPYGVRGMAGNVRDWCLDIYHTDGPERKHQCLDREDLSRHHLEQKDAQRAIRGGSWTDDANITRTAFRSWRASRSRSSYLGFRMIREYPVP